MEQQEGQTGPATQSLPDEKGFEDLDAAYRALLTAHDSNSKREDNSQIQPTETQPTESQNTQTATSPPPPEGQEGKEQPSTIPPTQEEPPEEPNEHGERSRLGRKVSGIETNVNNLSNTINAFMTTMNAFMGQMGNKQPGNSPQGNSPQDYQQNSAQVPQNQQFQSLEMPETVITPQDVMQVLKAKLPELQNLILKGTPIEDMKAKIEYQNTYISTLKSVLRPLESDPDLYKEMEQKLTGEGSEFNLTHSTYKDPIGDVTRNYGAALKAALSQRQVKPNGTAQPSVPLRQQNAPPTANVSASVRVQTPQGAVEELKLSPQELEFVKRTGMSEESVRRALKREQPPWLIKGGSV